jgi:N-acetylmuramoyl-L-alanine amidase
MNGAQSKNGVTEEAINLKITKKIQSLLEQSGCNVILTRSDENGIYNLDSKTIKEKKVSDIKNRVKIGNEDTSDIFVSIHLNKIPQSKYSGWQTFFKEGNKKSEELAKSIQEGLNDCIQKENKREALKIKGKYIIDNVEIPTTIVECGFLSNPEEERLLQQDGYQEKLAWGIYNGIIDYFLTET